MGTTGGGYGGHAFVLFSYPILFTKSKLYGNKKTETALMTPFGRSPF
jgi:hypothetical protein